MYPPPRHCSHPTSLFLVNIPSCFPPPRWCLFLSALAEVLAIIRVCLSPISFLGSSFPPYMAPVVSPPQVESCQDPPTLRPPPFLPIYAVFSRIKFRLRPLNATLSGLPSPSFSPPELRSKVTRIAPQGLLTCFSINPPKGGPMPRS